MTQESSKLYLVTRGDLAHGQQAVQAAHALREFTAYTKSNTLALLSIEDECSLQGLLERARRRGVHVAPFHEPDRNNELTALAIGPTGKSLCRRLPLALG